MTIVPPLVEITFTSKRREHPPITRLLFNITLHNSFDESRWFLLPSSLSFESSDIGEGGVYGLQVFALDGDGRVILGRFLGEAGFQSLLLPANAQVNLRRFPIQFYGELPAQSVNIDLIVADQLQVGGKPAETWVGMDPTSDSRADDSAEQRRRLGSSNTPDLETVPVSIDEVNRITLVVGF